MIIEDNVLVKVTSLESIGKFVIPDGVKIISSIAFDFCCHMTSIVIPDSVTDIGLGAFRHCVKLEKAIVGNGVREIGAWAFSGCYALKSIVLGSGVTSIGSSAFERCYNLTSKVANYKAFKLHPFGLLKCRNKIYREGRKSSAKGELKLCKNGIHYCTNLFEVFDHYSGGLDRDIAIYECEVSDENIGGEVTSKRCARWIIPRKRLYREDVIRILNGGE